MARAPLNKEIMGYSGSAPQWPPWRGMLLYLVTGVVWVFAGDALLAHWVSDPALLTRLQTWKGWSYVLLTSALAWWQCLVGAAVLWIGPLSTGWPAAGSWWWLAGLGLVHTALAYTLIYAGTTRLPVARIAILQYVYPAVALLIDWWYFDLHLSGLQLFGIVLMSAAIGYAERPQRSQSH